MPTRSHPSFSYNKKNKPNNWFVFFGGGGGIRTPVGVNPNGFQDFRTTSQIVPNSP